MNSSFAAARPPPAGLVEAVAQLEGRRRRRRVRRIALPLLGIVAVLAFDRLLAALRHSSAFVAPPVSPVAAGIFAAACGAAAFAAAFGRGRRFWAGTESRGRLAEWLITPGSGGRVTAATRAAWAAYALLATLPPAAGALVLSRPPPGAAHGLLAVLLLVLLAVLGSTLADLSFFLRRRLVSRAWAAAAAVLVLISLAALAWRAQAVAAGLYLDWGQQLARCGEAGLLITPLPCLAGLIAPAAWGAELRSLLGTAPPVAGIAAGYAAALALASLAAACLADAGWRRLCADPEGGGRGDARARPAAESEPHRGPFASTALWRQDLRLLLGDRTAPLLLTLPAAVLIACALLPLLLGGGRDLASASFQAAVRQGFRWLAVGMVGAATLIPPLLGVRTLSADREALRLHMLLVTPLRASRLLLAKWAAAAILSGIVLAPALPLLALIYVTRGAGPGEVVSLLLLVAALGTLNGFFGVASAAIHSGPGLARLNALFIAGLLAVVPGGALGSAMALSAGAQHGPVGQGLQSAPALLFGVILVAALWRNALERLRYPGS